MDPLDPQLVFVLSLKFCLSSFVYLIVYPVGFSLRPLHDKVGSPLTPFSPDAIA